jgi:mRNA-degrading endonuclease RelE of RelBE toxin-antitoxin system
MAKRIRAAFVAYAADPQAHANNVTKLVGAEGKRMRVGDFRAVFDENEETITVTKIAPRGQIYD